jgi:hypothetical protein
MQGTKTAKLKLDPLEEAEASLKSKLYVGEEVRWKGLPSSLLYLIDLSYKGLMWWSVFTFAVPIYGNSPQLTALLVLMLTYLEFKKKWNSRAYFITNMRAISADKLRNGEWKFTDYPLASLGSTKQTALLKSLIMKFNISNSTKTLKFLYVGNCTPALEVLSATTDQPAIESSALETTGVLRQNELAPKAAPETHSS